MSEAPLNALRECLDPAGYVDDPERIEGYLTDQRQLLRGKATAVLRPRSTADVAAIVKIARQCGISLVPQGGNTSYCGAATPDTTGHQVVISFERMSAIREVDATSMTLSVDAGVVLKDAQDAAAQEGLLLPLSLGSEGSCRIGGNIATNAGGVSVVKYGMTRDLILGLEVVLDDGTIVSDMRKLRKNNTGYDVKQLFCGSEGTLGLITGAVLKLSPQPVQRATTWMQLAKGAPLATMLNRVRRDSCDLITSFELITPRSMMLTGSLPQGLPIGSAGIILLELSASSSHLNLAELNEQIVGGLLEEGWIEDAVIAQSETQRHSMWQVRESIPEGEKHYGGSVKHDISVPLTNLSAFLDRATACVHAFTPSLELSVYGHVGDGNIHFNVLVPHGEDRLAFTAHVGDTLALQLYDIAAELGGTFSAEHGVGRFKRDLLSRYGDKGRLAVMRRVKSAFDPAGVLNPGVIV